ncbi:MAG: Fur family transcriptional regulator [Acidobacteriota bacterium]
MLNTERVKADFTQYLKQGKYRITPERFLVLDAVLGYEGHFDADELFLRVKTNGIRVSRATVYNTLDLLLDCGVVAKFRLGDNHSRYEKTCGKPHHDHLICLECGEIIEFVNKKIEKLQEEVCLENHFKAQSTSLQIFGVCAKCRKD